LPDEHYIDLLHVLSVCILVEVRGVGTDRAGHGWVLHGLMVLTQRTDSDHLLLGRVLVLHGCVVDRPRLHVSLGHLYLVDSGVMHESALISCDFFRVSPQIRGFWRLLSCIDSLNNFPEYG